MESRHRKLILVSLGAVNPSELAWLRRMPRFNALCARGTLVTGVESVFPSHPYPCLTSAIAGLPPQNHGIYDDARPGRQTGTQRWYRRHMQSASLPFAAMKSGLRVASILWPVTGGLKSRVCVPDYFEMKQGRLGGILHSDSSLFQASVLLKHGRLLPRRGKGGADAFAIAAALEALHGYSPDLLLLRLSELDEVKKAHGARSSEVRDALERYDTRVGLLVDAVRARGLHDSTDIVLFGGYGSLPVEKCVDLQPYFESMKREVYLRQSGGIACLRLARPKDEDLRRRTVQLLRAVADDPGAGIQRLLTEDEMRTSGLELAYEIGLEATPGWSFGPERVKAQHGYTLERGDYQSFYLAAGPGVPEDMTLTGGSIMDICALALALLDIKPWSMEGRLHVPLKE